MKDFKVLYQIKTLEGLIVRNFFSKVINEDKVHNIPTPTQMRILHYILESKKDEVYQNELEKAFNLRRATISGVLQTMEKNNLIIRVASEKDTRTKKIILSESAKEIFDNNMKKLLNIESVITKGISKNELDNFCKIIEKMRKNIEFYE